MTVSQTSPPSILKLLCHDIRWQLVKALAHSDRRVQELAQLLSQPQNLVSYHLQKLRENHLVHEHRSSADGREVYYYLDLDRLKRLYFASGEDIHPALWTSQPSKEENIRGLEPVRVLFLCTNNSARSQMAEGILRARSNGQIEVFSAGTDPTSLHPLAVRAMAEMNIDVSRQHSKDLDQLLGERFDYIITVCDRAREACPVFPGDPNQIHWSIPDPAAVSGSESECYQAFKQAAIQLNTRITYLLLVLQRRRLL